MADDLTPDQARLLDAWVEKNKPTPEQLRGIRALEQVVARQSTVHPRTRARLAERQAEGFAYWDNLAAAFAREPAAPGAPGAVGAAVPTPPLPNPKQLNSYTHGTLEKAVKQFARDGTVGDVVRGAKRAQMPRPDARRVRALWVGKLFRLNASGRLLVDGRVARKVVGTTSRYVLRYLSAAGTSWLDPNREPPKP